ncbi:protein kinase [Kitasatospora gansuensis]
MWGRGTVLGGRYTLTERVGGGGMGDVWRADDQVLERQVAVKVLHAALMEDEQFAERFRREARLLAALSHPGIVDVHDYGESADGPDGQVAYIVMELIDGRPLHVVLEQDGPLSAERALGLLAEALDALHAAHLQDIVHRDIKPSNLMIRADDRVAVTDFGIARAAASTKITASHAVLGTALYMAPEQAEGGAINALSDLYSIGVVCYELLTGQVPFGGESMFEIVLKHVREPAPGLPPSFSPAVRQFVATALAKQPEHRYPDAATMAAAARAAIAGTRGPATVPATAAGLPRRCWPPPSRCWPRSRINPVPRGEQAETFPHPDTADRPDRHHGRGRWCPADRPEPAGQPGEGGHLEPVRAGHRRYELRWGHPRFGCRLLAGSGDPMRPRPAPRRPTRTPGRAPRTSRAAAPSPTAAAATRAGRVPVRAPVPAATPVVRRPAARQRAAARPAAAGVAPPRRRPGPPRRPRPRPRRPRPPSRRGAAVRAGATSPAWAAE